MINLRGVRSEGLEDAGVCPRWLGNATSDVVVAFFAGLEGVAVAGPEGEAADPGLLVGPGFEGARCADSSLAGIKPQHDFTE